jgi:hypothetical protein
VYKRLGTGVDWAATQAHRAIHDNDVERLKHLLVEYPAFWGSPPAPTAMRSHRRAKAGSPARRAPSC